MSQPCCDYRDHSGDHTACSCECHGQKCHDRSDSYCLVCGYRTSTISVDVGRLLGLAEAWEHIAQVNSTAARGTYDDGLGRMAARAAEKIRQIIEDAA